MSFIGVIASSNLEARILSNQNPYLRIAIAGVGQEHATIAARTLLRQGAVALLSWGVAGSLNSQLSPGNIILPKQICLENGDALSVNLDWHLQVSKLLTPHINFSTAKLLESPSIVSSAVQKKYLGSLSSAVAVDMESYSLAQVAHNKVPFLVMRAIVDAVDQNLPKFVQIAQTINGRLNVVKLLQHFLHHPQEIVPLMQLGRYFLLARSALKKTYHIVGNFNMGYKL